MSDREGNDVRQILYVSLSTAAGDKVDLAGILRQSRHNNALDGITGLLWSDGRSFMQVVEGPRSSVAATYARVYADTRHHALRILDDRLIDAREFGSGNMVHRRAGEPADAYDAMMLRLLAKASESVRDQFANLVTTGMPARPLQQAS